MISRAAAHGVQALRPGGLTGRACLQQACCSQTGGDTSGLLSSVTLPEAVPLGVSKSAGRITGLLDDGSQHTAIALEEARAGESNGLWYLLE